MIFTITPTLLNSWLYLWTDFEKYVFDTSEKTAEDYRKSAHDDFLTTLRRKPTQTTEAMQKGIDFEDLVVTICGGVSPTDHKWYEAANEIAQEVKGSQFQVTVKKNIEIAGLAFQLKGRLDCLKAGIINDIKFSGKYEVGKFYGSAQHPLYMEAIPEAFRFNYLISNGTRVWRETYARAEIKPIGETIQGFIEYLKNAGLLPLYQERWKVND